MTEDRGDHEKRGESKDSLEELQRKHHLRYVDKGTVRHFKQYPRYPKLPFQQVLPKASLQGTVIILYSFINSRH